VIGAIFGPTRSSAQGPPLDRSLNGILRQHHILNRRQIRNQVKLLEDESDFSARNRFSSVPENPEVWPSMKMSPELGRSRHPIGSRGDFPDPDGPMIAIHSPLRTESENAVRARICPWPRWLAGYIFLT